MNIKIILFTFFVSLSVSLEAQEFWTLGTAIPVKKKRVEVALFEPSRLGITNKLELNVQPFAFFVLPNVGIKKLWIYRKPSADAKIWKKGYYFSTIHAFNFPTFALKIARNKQIRHLISDSIDIPGIFAFKNEALISSFLKPRTSCEPANYLLTLKLGTKLAFTTKKTNWQPIEKGVLYRETAIYQKKLLWYVGADLDANFRQYFNYAVDLEFYSIGLKPKNWSIEHRGIIYDDVTHKLRVALGYKAGLTKMPAKMKFFIYPLIDVVYTFNRPKGKQMELFESGIFNINEDRSEFEVKEPKKTRKEKKEEEQKKQ